MQSKDHSDQCTSSLSSTPHHHHQTNASTSFSLQSGLATVSECASYPSSVHRSGDGEWALEPRTLSGASQLPRPSFQHSSSPSSSSSHDDGTARFIIDGNTATILQPLQQPSYYASTATTETPDSLPLSSVSSSQHHFSSCVQAPPNRVCITKDLDTSTLPSSNDSSQAANTFTHQHTTGSTSRSFQEGAAGGYVLHQQAFLMHGRSSSPQLPSFSSTPIKRKTSSTSLVTLSSTSSASSTASGICAQLKSLIGTNRSATSVAASDSSGKKWRKSNGSPSNKDSGNAPNSTNITTGVDAVCNNLHAGSDRSSIAPLKHWS